MAIRAYQGELPDKCRICLSNEYNRDSLFQTYCCTNSHRTERILQTYHKDCLRDWSRIQLGDSFSCLNKCGALIPKSTLFSRIERAKQFLFSPSSKKYFKRTVVNSIILGSALVAAVVIDGHRLDDSHDNSYKVPLAAVITAGLSSSIMSGFSTFTKSYINVKPKEYSLFIVTASVPSMLIFSVAFKAITLFMDKYR